MAAGSTTEVALLRGINVGGKHRLAMRELIALFEGAGCAEVRTYIQSGNVIYRAPGAVRKSLPERVAAEIERRFGYRVPVVTRSAAELRAVLERNPFAARGDEQALHVAFLAARPSAAALRALDPERSPPDELAALGREIYLRLPNGVARTKLTNAYLDRALGTVSTLRNWATVRKLAELCG